MRINDGFIDRLGRNHLRCLGPERGRNTSPGAAIFCKTAQHTHFTQDLNGAEYYFHTGLVRPDSGATIVAQALGFELEQHERGSKAKVARLSR